MKGNVKLAIRAAAFLLLAALTFEGVSAVCRRSSWAPVTNAESGYDAYSKLDRLTPYPIDVVAFGQSYCACSFAALELYGQYGISAYNIGGSWQPGIVSYYLLRALLEHQRPKVIVLEVNALFTAWGENPYRVGFDALPLSAVKLEAIKAHSETEGSDSQMSYVVNLSKYHFAWKNLKEYGFHDTDPAKNQLLYQGYRIRKSIYAPSNEYLEFQGWTDTGDGQAEYYDEGYTYFCKFAELCKSKGIELVLYKDFSTTWKPEQYNAVKALADQYGIPYIDFHMKDVFSMSGINYATDLADTVHDNLSGAVKVTRYLGEYLHENYDLPDHRGDQQYAELEQEYTGWLREVFSEQFFFERNMGRYLDLLSMDEAHDYTVIFSVKDNCQRSLGDELYGKLRGLGFQSEKVFREYGHSFIGIWRNGSVIYEEESETTDNPEKDMIEFSGVLPDGMKYYIKSAGYRCGNISSILIDGVEYSKNSRGINVVVYDNLTGRVVDSICWDTHLDAGTTYVK